MYRLPSFSPATVFTAFTGRHFTLLHGRETRSYQQRDKSSQCQVILSSPRWNRIDFQLAWSDISQKTDALYLSWETRWCALWHSCLVGKLPTLQPGNSWERWEVGWKATRKSLISNNQHYPWSGPAMPASAVIGEEFAGFGIRLGVFGQAGGIFSHSLSSHPEEFQVNRDWPVFWSARRNLLVWNCVKWRS